MFNLLIIFACVISVRSDDLTVGTDLKGNKIFDEDRQANAAVFSRQVQNVTIDAPDNEVISRIVVTDMRPEKDGDVKIVDGGQGQKNVTLELKSPTILRGFAFHIEVYSSPEDKVKSTTTSQKTDALIHPSETRLKRKPEDYHKNDEVDFSPPITAFKDTNNPADAKLPHLISTDIKINEEQIKRDTNAENVYRTIVKPSEKTSETKIEDRLNSNKKKTSNVEERVHEHRHTREVIEESKEKSNEPKIYEVNAGKILPSSQPPTEKSNHGVLSKSSEQASIPKFVVASIHNAPNDGKRDARDTEPKANIDKFKIAATTDNISKPDSNIRTQTSKIPTTPHEFKRQVSITPENNKDHDISNNQNKPSVPLRLANVDSTANDTSKQRIARETDENDKAVVNPPSVAEDSMLTLTFVNNQRPNPDEETAKLLPPINDQKQKRDTQSTTEKYGKPNTGNPRSFRPQPYTTSSTTTTEKSQNKRDTESRVSDDRKENKDDSNNKPQLFGNNQKPNPDGETVKLFPPIIDQKQKRDTQSTVEHYGKPNTDKPRSFRPLPYTTSSTTTTGKSQNKRDTESKVTDDGKENKDDLKNKPQLFVNNQKPNPDGETAKLFPPIIDHKQKRDTQSTTEKYGKPNTDKPRSFRPQPYTTSSTTTSEKSQNKRDTESKVSDDRKVSKDDSKNKPQIFGNNQKPNHDGETAKLFPPIIDQKQKRDTQSTTEKYGKPNTDKPRSFRPQPYTTSSTTTTEKSQNKRDTESKVSDDRKENTDDSKKSQLFVNNQNSNPDGETAKLSPPIIDQKQKRDTQSTTEHYGKTNTDKPRSFRPLPYTTSSTTTTEKSQNKRDTESKVSDDGKGNRDDSKNKPQLFGRKTPAPEQKPVISIQ